MPYHYINTRKADKIVRFHIIVEFELFVAPKVGIRLRYRTWMQ